MAVIVVAIIGLAAPAVAATREALVIAVADYKSVPKLANPVNDARLVASALKATGFAVAEVINPDRNALVDAIATFRQRASGAEAAVIYFAGHGVEIDGSNYLMPRDAQSGSVELIKDTSVRSTTLGSGVNGATRMRLLVLDACRDNPFANLQGDSATRSVATSRGLAREVVRGVVTLLATSAGQKAADKSEVAPNNSPFARAFAEVLQVPGLGITRLPTQVSRSMETRDHVSQQPDQIGVWSDDDFTLLPRAGGSAAPAVVAAPAPAAVVPASVMAVRPLAPAARASAPEIFAAFGIVVQRTDATGNGILIKSVQPGGPAIGKVFPDDIILKINGLDIDPTLSPTQAIASAMGDKGVARLQIQRGPTTTSIVLRK